jgi:hypothetical protein
MWSTVIAAVSGPVLVRKAWNTVCPVVTAAAGPTLHVRTSGANKVQVPQAELALVMKVPALTRSVMNVPEADPSLRTML